MHNLIIPMAGRSSRFEGLRPKWMLTHPKTNRFMVTEAISGMNLESFDRIYFVCLKSQEEKYSFKKGFLDDIRTLFIENKVEIIFLDKPTSSQAETVKKAIEIGNIKGSIFVKDCDAFFKANIPVASNCVTYFDLNNITNINARSKSYIELDIHKFLTNIVEKKVISSTFSVGGYGFENGLEFVEKFNNISNVEGEIYVSHIIFEMLLSGSKFSGVEASEFLDWGTIEDWNNYKSQYKCLFIDIDGTIITNSSKHFPPYIGDGNPLKENINLLKELYKRGKTYIILTTSRSSDFKEKTINELNKYGVPYDQLIMDLPHCQRVLINDYSLSNPYPSASSINIIRNSDELNSFFS